MFILTITGWRSLGQDRLCEYGHVNRGVALGLLMIANNPEAPKWNEANPKAARYVTAWRARHGKAKRRKVNIYNDSHYPLLAFHLRMFAGIVKDGGRMIRMHGFINRVLGERFCGSAGPG